MDRVRAQPTLALGAVAAAAGCLPIWGGPLLTGIGTDLLLRDFGGVETASRGFSSNADVMLQLSLEAAGAMIETLRSSLNSLHEDKEHRNRVTDVVARCRSDVWRWLEEAGSSEQFEALVTPVGGEDVATPLKDIALRGIADGNRFASEADNRLFHTFVDDLDSHFQSELNSIRLGTSELGLAARTVIDDLRNILLVKLLQQLNQQYQSIGKFRRVSEITTLSDDTDDPDLMLNIDPTKPLVELEFYTEALSLLDLTRRIVITGVPGAGKSRLAYWLLERLAEQHPEIVVIFPNGSSDSPDLAPYIGLPLVLVIDDLHDEGATFNAQPWWTAVHDVGEPAFVLILSQSGIWWDRARVMHAAFLKRIAGLDGERLIELPANLSDDDVNKIIKAHELDPDAVRSAKHNTIGTIVNGGRDSPSRERHISRSSVYVVPSNGTSQSGMQSSSKPSIGIFAAYPEPFFEETGGRDSKIEDMVGMFMSSARQALSSGKEESLHLRRMTEYLLDPGALGQRVFTQADRAILNAYGQTVIGLTYEESGAFPADEGFLNLWEASTLAEEVNDTQLTGFVNWSLGHYWRKRADVTKDHVDIRRARRLLGGVLDSPHGSPLFKSLAAIEITKIVDIGDNNRIDLLNLAIEWGEDVISTRQLDAFDPWLDLLGGFHQAVLREARLRLMARERDGVRAILSMAETSSGGFGAGLTLNENVGLPYTIAQAILRSPDASVDQRGQAIEKIWNAQLYSFRQGFRRQVWSGTQILTNKQLPLLLPDAYDGPCPKCHTTTTWILEPNTSFYRCDRCQWVRSVQ